MFVSSTSLNDFAETVVKCLTGDDLPCNVSQNVYLTAHQIFSMRSSMQRIELLIDSLTEFEDLSHNTLIPLPSNLVRDLNYTDATDDKEESFIAKMETIPRNETEILFLNLIPDIKVDYFFNLWKHGTYISYSHKCS